MLKLKIINSIREGKNFIKEKITREIIERITKKVRLKIKK
jgi:hypothetical protein